ncbi:MAG: polysaccharide deacetylase family protein [Hyphomicrobium sp.]|nr:polysaccharide deacetylase family protein [Hyphomicrobium sp.]MBN9268335.1 polysaccharide deacetylase family protein [Hyphomicrobium sp.]
MIRAGLVTRWAVAVIAIGSIAAIQSGVSPLAAQQDAQPQSKCKAGPNTLGVSRTVEIDTTGGPRFGRLQYRDHDFLQEGEVVLTFDDGPHPTFTPMILDALDEQCTKATFFVLGQRALSFPAQLREVGRRGHTIGTHTWAHANLGRSSAAQVESQIELGISAAQLALDGPTAPFFRFPYLSDPGAGQRHLQSRDIANISIDVDSHDFRTKSPSRMIANVLRGLQEKKKGIILFHDIQPSTAHGIRQMLVELKSRGYRIVHIKPKQSQSTVAEYDQRLERDRHARPPRVAAVRPSSAPAARPAPQQAEAPAASQQRIRDTRDWRDTIFGRW